jgi:hypothetical protein
MSKFTVVALAAALVVAPLSARAGDGKDKEKVKKEESKEKTKKSSKSEDRGGFTGFWIHTVGGTIGNGLKGGADKISKAF